MEQHIIEISPMLARHQRRSVNGALADRLHHALPFIEGAEQMLRDAHPCIAAMLRRYIAEAAGVIETLRDSP